MRLGERCGHIVQPAAIVGRGRRETAVEDDRATGGGRVATTAAASMRPLSTFSSIWSKSTR